MKYRNSEMLKIGKGTAIVNTSSISGLSGHPAIRDMWAANSESSDNQIDSDAVCKPASNQLHLSGSDPDKFI
jgi:hypothetical protein